MDNKPRPKVDLIGRAFQTETPQDPTGLSIPQDQRRRPSIDLIGGATQLDLGQPQTVETPGTWGAVASTLAPIFDVLSRGQYASAKFFDSLGDESKTMLDRISEAAQEIYDPKYRMSFSDVIKKNAPVWSRDNPTSTAVIGFLGDIFLDPTTYLGVGFAKSGVKVGGRVLTSKGAELLGASIKAELATTGNKLLAQGVERKIVNQEVRRNAEQNIMSLIDNQAFFESNRARATFFGKTIPGSEAVLNVLGLNKVAEGVAEVGNVIRRLDTEAAIARKNKIDLTIPQRIGEGLGTIAGTFNRDFNLPQEWIDLRKHLENRKDSIADEVERETIKLFSNIKAERRQVIGRALAGIDDATREAEQIASGLGRSMTQAEYSNIVKTTLAKMGIDRDPEEMALVSSLFQAYKNAGELEMQAGLLKGMLENYSPRRYQALALSHPSEIPFYNKSIRGIGTNLSAAKEREFLTLQEAEALGFKPELDAAMLYASRMVESRQKIANKQFRDSINEVFGFENFDQLPARYRNDVKLIGESIYPDQMNSDTANILKAYDFMQKYFKMAATTLRPAFAAKQLVSNTFQSAMSMGIKSFRAFDPRSFADAGLLLLDRGKPTKNLPDFVTNLIARHSGEAGVDAVLAQRTALAKITGEERLANYAKDFKLTDVFGQQYTGEELVELARTNGVIRGFDITGERFQRKVAEALDYNPNSVKSVAWQLMKFWQHAGIAEDYSRMTHFINGMRMGYRPEEASKLVNKALFDYSRGLSAIEKNVFRRVLPFYTFTRFATPYVLKQSATKAGIPLTAEKTFQLFDKLFNSGETLTEAERTIFGDTYLVEQPRMFRGFDKEGQAVFNVFNNLTPLDTLSMLKYDKQGNIDFARTAETTVLAALTPFLKVPLELSQNRNFFTGRTLDEAGKLGATNRIPFADAVASVIPKFVQEAIGWENRVNVRTGEMTTYVSPYMAHTVASFVPAIKQFIRPLNPDEDPLQASMELMLGISAKRIDLQRQGEITLNNLERQAREVQARIRSARFRGSEDQFTKAKNDYIALMQDYARTSKAIREMQGENRKQSNTTQTIPQPGQ